MDVPVKILESFGCVEGYTFNRNTKKMDEKLAEKYQKDGLVEILKPEKGKPCNDRKTKAILPSKNKRK